MSITSIQRMTVAPTGLRLTASMTPRGRLLLTPSEDALLDFRMEMMIDGDRMTPAEVRQIIASANGLALIRAQ